MPSILKVFVSLIKHLGGSAPKCEKAYDYQNTCPTTQNLSANSEPEALYQNNALIMDVLHEDDAHSLREHNSQLAVMALSIDVLGLKTRAYNALTRLNVKTLGELLDVNETQVQILRGHGAITWHNIKDAQSMVLKLIDREEYPEYHELQHRISESLGQLGTMNLEEDTNKQLINLQDEAPRV